MKPAARSVFSVLLCLFSLLLCLSGCSKDEAATPTIPQFKWLREKAEYLAVTVTEEDFAALEECINLEYLDLSGSTCYDAILDYIARHPEVDVVYTVPLGNLTLSNFETKATLAQDSYQAETLLKQLKYLPRLSVLELPKTSLTAEELAALQQAYPGLSVSCTVEFMGREYAPTDTSVDLSGLSAEQIEEVAARLALLPGLTEVELMDSSGKSSLTKEHVKQLMEAVPQAEFHYTFDFFGKTISCADETVELKDVNIGDDGEGEVRAALDILPKCTYFKLEDCGMSNEVLASIRDDYPDTKVVWRVHFGGQYSVLTDAETMRTVYGVYNSHADTLKYCTSLKYIDMGHNPDLTDISFIEYMPDLEIVILSGASMTDLEPFANHKKLEWLELANCYALSDISALESCENLRFLNIAFAKVSDLTPIENLPLERFLYLNPQINWETRKTFEENHPDCWVRFTGSDPYSLGWRYNDIGMTMFDYYLKIREIFDYDGVDRRVAAQEEAKRREEEANRPVETTPPETTPPATTPPATTPPATTPPATTPPATTPPATTPPATTPPATTPPAATPETPPAPEAPVNSTPET